MIQSSGMGALHLIRNKQWYEARFQSVVDALIGEVEFIRVGSATDPVMQNANDRQGTTGSERRPPSCTMRGYMSERWGS